MLNSLLAVKWKDLLKSFVIYVNITSPKVLTIRKSLFFSFRKATILLQSELILGLASSGAKTT